MKEIKLKGIDETIYVDECDCGLKIIMWVSNKVHTFYGTLSTKYGSIHNNFKIDDVEYNMPTGIAHFLEHLKFNESAEFTAHDYFNKMGSSTNAFTTFHYTNYQVFGNYNPKDNVNHLLDFVYNPYFTKSMVKNEKGIIIEEAKMGEDDPYTVMLFKHLNNLFNESEYKRTITGKVEDIKKIKLEDILLVYNTFYHPENMFLIVTGNFNPYEIAESVKATMAGKSFDKFKKPEILAKKEPKKVSVPYEEVNINITNQKIKYGFKISKKEFKDFDDLHIRIFTNMILKANFGNSSDFKDELLQKEIISSMSYMSEIFDNYLTVMFTIDSEMSDLVIELLEEKLNNLEISEKTFRRLQKANIASVILNYEDVENVNVILQEQILYYGKIIDNSKEIYEELKYEDIIKFIRYFDTSNSSILVLKPSVNNQG